jgi:hypothetical protein
MIFMSAPHTGQVIVARSFSLSGITRRTMQQKTDELFAAWVEKAVTPGPAKALWQHMDHQQVKKIFSGDGPGPVLPGLGMEIPEGDPSVFAFEDIQFPDDAPVEISAKINDCLVAVTHGSQRPIVSGNLRARSGRG